MLFRCRSSLLVLWYPELFKEETYEVAKFDESMSNVALSFLDETNAVVSHLSFIKVMPAPLEKLYSPDELYGLITSACRLTEATEEVLSNASPCH